MNWSVWCWIWVLNWRFLIFSLLFVEVSEWNQFIVDSNYIKRLVNEYFAMLSKWRNMQRCRFCYNRWKRAASSAGRTSVTRPSSSLQTTTKEFSMCKRNIVARMPNQITSWKFVIFFSCRILEKKTLIQQTDSYSHQIILNCFTLAYSYSTLSSQLTYKIKTNNLLHV